jgi:hypothetical protein
MHRRCGNVLVTLASATVGCMIEGLLRVNKDLLAARHLQPSIRVLRESGALDSYDAEALRGGRLHHYPTLQANHDLRAQHLKARNLGGNVVALNIDVYATFMIHTLDLHNGFVRRSLQHVVISASTRVIGVYRATQGPAPEASSLLYGGPLAVYQDGAEAGMVHNDTLRFCEETAIRNRPLSQGVLAVGQARP